MKKLSAFLFASFLFLSFSGCAVSAPPAEPTPTSKPAEYHKISAADAKARLDSGDELILLDVRTKEEYDAGHIADAILVPNETISDEAAAKLPDKNATYLLYCRTGIRAGQAAQKLADLGYTDVYSFGGISTWPYDIVK